LRSDWVISGSIHGAVLLVGLVTIASSKPTEDLSNFVPVSIVTDANISRAALGELNAPNVAEPHPLGDKIGAVKPVSQTAPKVAEKPVTTPTPPMPPSKPQPKPDPKQAQKPEQKTADFKPDKIAELLNHQDPQKPPKPPDKPQPQTPRYDANQIAELLDKRDPQRETATAPTLSSTPGLGAPTAAADAQLSQSEIDALRQRIRDCWSPPPGVDTNSTIYVSLRVLFKPDGSLAQVPVVVAGSASPLGPALAESGKRALLLCQPFTMLKPEHYAQWKDITVDFSPHDLSGN
jgi:outer membrane biosynthesis protein TonB